MDGRVVRLVMDEQGRSKGFGFIAGPDGVERFFHRSGVRNKGFDELKEGDNVTFELAESAKGPRAENVERV